MIFNLNRPRNLDDARTVMSAWREQRDAMSKARARKGTNVDGMLKKNERRVASLIAAVLRKAGRKAARSAKEVLKAQVSQAKIDKILEDLDADGVSVEIMDEISSSIRKVYAEANAQAVASVGVDSSGYSLQHADELAIKYAEERAADQIAGISDTTREDLRSLITESVGEGQSAADLADQIEDSFAFSPQRAETIARTELAEAHVQGNLQGWRDTGAVSQKRWIVGGGCCSDCDEMDGAVVDLDEDFETDDGPIDGPPLHPNCRCDIEPLLKEEASDQSDQEEE